MDAVLDNLFLVIFALILAGGFMWWLWSLSESVGTGSQSQPTQYGSRSPARGGGTLASTAQQARARLHQRLQETLGQPEPAEGLSAPESQPLGGPELPDEEGPMDPLSAGLRSAMGLPEDAPPQPAPPERRVRAPAPGRRLETVSRLRFLSGRQGLRDAILAQEVLGPPKSLRPPDEGPPLG